MGNELKSLLIQLKLWTVVYQLQHSSDICVEKISGECHYSRYKKHFNGIFSHLCLRSITFYIWMCFCAYKHI